MARHFMEVDVARYYFGSARVVESELALADPPGKPSTCDMVAMVDHLRELGLIRRRPTVYALPDGLVVVHPRILADLRRELSERINREVERMMHGAGIGRPVPL
jgi:hypothetical protein